MGCIASKQWRCCVLVQLALSRQANRRLGVCVLVAMTALALRCDRAGSASSPTQFHLIIPEGYRGAIDFYGARPPAPATWQGEKRIVVDDYGNAEIDSIEQLEEVGYVASLTSGESLKTSQLGAKEVGLRCAYVFQLEHSSLQRIYFVGSGEEFEDFLREEYRRRRPGSATPKHQVESKLGPGYLSRVSVTNEMIQGTPAWDGEGEPPLSVGQAIKLAKAATRSGLVSDPFMTRCERATLVRFDLGTVRHWYWRVRFEAEGMGISGVPPISEVVVLMNGRVVPPDLVKSDRLIDPAPP